MGVFSSDAVAAYTKKNPASTKKNPANDHFNIFFVFGGVLLSSKI